jgi:hypothetical protein
MLSGQPCLTELLIRIGSEAVYLYRRCCLIIYIPDVPQKVLAEAMFSEYRKQVFVGNLVESLFEVNR